MSAAEANDRNGGRSDDALAPPLGPFAALALCWITGTTAGASGPAAIWWAAAAALPCAAMLVAALRRRHRQARHWAMLAVVPLAAGWADARLDHLPADHVKRCLASTPVLQRVRGIVDAPPRISPPQRGAFAHVHWAPPVTLFTLRLESIRSDDRWARLSGRLAVKIAEADHRLRQGDRIEATGWLSRLRGPMNPGERDTRKILARRGIDARLMLDNRGNWRLVNRRADGWLDRFRRRSADRAAASLRLGMADDRSRLALLDAILLGRRQGGLGEQTQTFREVGLAHLLSISGAHLAILMGLIWVASRLVLRRPNAHALLVLLALGSYLLVVPWRVPIVRASVMSALFAAGYVGGRVVRGTELLALAALIVLIRWPADLFTPGFQLSFGCVAGLIWLTRPLSHRFCGRPTLDPPRGVRNWLARRAAVYVAANLVAFLVAMPLVAYHFELITPLAAPLSLLAIPFVTLALGLGYLKVVMGLLWPSLGMAMAWPVEVSTDLMSGLVTHASGWPGATIVLSRPPSELCVVALMAVVAAALSGWFAQRRAPFAVAVAICFLWLVVRSEPAQVARFVRRQAEPLRMNMLAVGDGSCFVMRFGADRPRVLMFDCGSLAYLDVGGRTVWPALKQMGVRKIDTLVLSHADLDHYCGVLDIVDRVPVRRVLVSPQLLAAAEIPSGPAPTAAPENPQRPNAVAFLVDGLRGRGVPIHPVSAGWREAMGPASLRILWPPADFESARTNDVSLVMSARIATGTGGRIRRVIMNGDIQQRAISELLDANVDLRADVCDLPHHGSRVESSPRWLDAVSPSIVLQSCGPARWMRDEWQPLMRATGIRRLVTARDGMVELVVRDDGAIRWRTFRNPLQ